MGRDIYSTDPPEGRTFGSRNFPSTHPLHHDTLPIRSKSHSQTQSPIITSTHRFAPRWSHRFPGGSATLLGTSCSVVVWVGGDRLARLAGGRRGRSSVVEVGRLSSKSIVGRRGRSSVVQVGRLPSKSIVEVGRRSSKSVVVRRGGSSEVGRRSTRTGKPLHDHRMHTFAFS